MIHIPQSNSETTGSAKRTYTVVPEKVSTKPKPNPNDKNH